MVRHSQQKPPDRNTIIIQPDLTGFNYHNLKHIDGMIQRGELAARESIGRLLRKLK